MSLIDRLREGCRWEKCEPCPVQGSNYTEIDGGHAENIMNEAADLLEDMRKEIKRKRGAYSACRELGDFLEKRLRDES